MGARPLPGDPPATEERAAARAAPTEPSLPVAPVGAPVMGARPLPGDLPDMQERTATRAAPTEGYSLGQIIGAYKSLTTRQYILGVQNLGWPPFTGRLWQRNYYEHVLRSDVDLDRARAYILENPLRWSLDQENPWRQT